MASELDKRIEAAISFVQQSKRLRTGAATVFLTGALGAAGYFAYQAAPRTFDLRLSGGELIDNRHFLAKALQDEAATNGANIEIVSTKGSLEAIAAVDAGTIDLAFVQGGLDFDRFTHTRHVATLNPEQLHIVVRENINTVMDLRGKVINLGSRSEGTRIIAKKVLAFSGLEDTMDYGETYLSAEEIVALKPALLPDAFMIISYAPSFLVDLLVKERGYRLLEIPFPPSLALREGWVATGTILSYTYSVQPPVPLQDLRTVSVSLHLVANEKTDPRAVSLILGTIFSPGYEARIRMKLDESKLTAPSGLPLSAGTTAFIARNDPLISASVLARLQSLFGAAMGLVSSLLLVVKWLRGHAPKRSSSDDELKSLIMQVLAIEDGMRTAGKHGKLTNEMLAEAELRLAELKSAALRSYPHTKFEDPGLLDRLLAAIEGARLDVLNHHLEITARSEVVRAA